MVAETNTNCPQFGGFFFARVKNMEQYKTYIFNVNFTGNMDIEIEADSVEDAIQMVKRGFYHEVEVASKIHKELAPDETWILKEKKEIK